MTDVFGFYIMKRGREKHRERERYLYTTTWRARFFIRQKSHARTGIHSRLFAVDCRERAHVIDLNPPSSLMLPNKLIYTREHLYISSRRVSAIFTRVSRFCKTETKRVYRSIEAMKNHLWTVCLALVIINLRLSLEWKIFRTGSVIYWGGRFLWRGCNISIQYHCAQQCRD